VLTYIRVVNRDTTCTVIVQYRYFVINQPVHGAIMAYEVSYVRFVQDETTQEQLRSLLSLESDLGCLGLMAGEACSTETLFVGYTFGGKVSFESEQLDRIAETGASFVIEYQYKEDAITGIRHRLGFADGKWWQKTRVPVYNWEEDEERWLAPVHSGELS
jgi:hypothetical protein